MEAGTEIKKCSRRKTNRNDEKNSDARCQFGLSDWLALRTPLCRRQSSAAIRFCRPLVKALDPARNVAVLSDGTELPYALFLGVPVHRVPQIVVESGLAAHAYDWVPVNKQTLETRFPGVYAVGDVNGVGTPKAGVFAEGSAQVVAARFGASRLECWFGRQAASNVR